MILLTVSVTTADCFALADRAAALLGGGGRGGVTIAADAFDWLPVVTDRLNRLGG